MVGPAIGVSSTSAADAVVADEAVVEVAVVLVLLAAADSFLAANRRMEMAEEAGRGRRIFRGA